MKAMIFAAGLGSRLKPLTDTRPKALITVGGKTMLEHIILKLKAAGFDEIVINVHHFSNQILAFLEANQNFGIDIQISDETDIRWQREIIDRIRQINPSCQIIIATHSPSMFGAGWGDKVVYMEDIIK